MCEGMFDVPVPYILESGTLVLTKTPQQAVRPRKPPSKQISCEIKQHVGIDVSQSAVDSHLHETPAAGTDGHAAPPVSQS